MARNHLVQATEPIHGFIIMNLPAPIPPGTSIADGLAACRTGQRLPLFVEFTLSCGDTILYERKVFSHGVAGARCVVPRDAVEHTLVSVGVGLRETFVQMLSTHRQRFPDQLREDKESTAARTDSDIAVQT